MYIIDAGYYADEDWVAETKEDDTQGSDNDSYQSSGGTDDSGDSDFDSDEDPGKLYCLCQRPYSKRYVSVA